MYLISNLFSPNAFCIMKSQFYSLNRMRNCVLRQLLLMLAVLFCIGLYAKPVISSFLPLSAQVGDTVAVSGTGFSTVAQGNTVFFGGVASVVVEASATLVKVIVPQEASYSRITLTTGGLTAYSNLQFSPMWPAAGRHIDTGAFSPSEILIPHHGGALQSVAFADFDLDGRTDLVEAAGDKLYVYKANAAGNIQKYTAGQQIADNIVIHDRDANCITIADIDCDGKQDIMVSKTNYDVWVLRNNSTGAGISFEAGKAFPTAPGYFPTGVIAVGDMNNDGKPDLITNTGRAGSFSLLINNSSADNISFAPYQYFSTGVYEDSYVIGIYGVSIGDFNNDGWADIIARSHSRDPNVGIYSRAFLLRNLGSTHSVSFKKDGYFDIDGFVLSDVRMADFDGDGKLDLAIKMPESLMYTVKNTSAVGKISFAAPVSYASSSAANILSVADMDGDSKPDIVFYERDSVAIYQNISTVSGPLFEKKLMLPAARPNYLTLTDQDGDGRVDIVYTSASDSSVSGIYNGIGLSGPVDVCQGGEALLAAVGINQSFQWQVSADRGASFSNLADGTEYAGASTKILTVKNVLPAYHGQQYRAVINGKPAKHYSLLLVNKWKEGVEGSWDNPANWSCGTVPNDNTNVVIESGTVLVNENAICNSLVVRPGATVRVATGVSLTVRH